MSRPRWLLLGGLAVVTVLLALFLRDTIYQLVVVPLAYLLWVGEYYYAAIPQAVLWVVLIGVLFLILLWNLMPERETPRRKARRMVLPEGRVETLAISISKTNSGNYFKWQLANRLGRIARELGVAGTLNDVQGEMKNYLDAGLTRSFVDFPVHRHWFGRRTPTALDVAPPRVVEYLEAQMEKARGRQA